MPDPTTSAFRRPLRRVLAAALASALAGAAPASAADPAEPGIPAVLRIAVYDAPPYGSLDRTGLFTGVSVDLWRRVAEDRGWRYALTSVPAMDDVIAGVEQGRFDAAIGAITITPERLGRVDFSYPTHRSGVAVASRRQNGMAAALAAYGTVASHLGALVVLMLVLLLATGALIWISERRTRGAESDTAIGTLHEGLYWAVVTMTTVGYGDKTPKTHLGRAVAVAWMLGSLVLISLFSTSVVAQLTAQQLDGEDGVRPSDIAGRRLAAASGSSGAEYLATAGFAFDRYPSLGDALDALAARRADAVVNSVGALDDAIAKSYGGTIELRHGLLAPALIGIALPRGSALRLPLDRSLARITTTPEWLAVEASYFTRGAIP